jgi:hypothetical protein
VAQFASSNFNGTAGDNLSTFDANWKKQTGTTGNAEIVDGRGRQSTTATALYYYDAAPGGADYTVSVDVYNPGSVTNSNLGPVARAASGANTHYHARYSTASGAVQLYKFVAGSATLLGTAARLAPASGGFATILLSVSGSTIEVTFNGEGSPLVSATDGSISAAGFPGIRWLATTAPSNTAGWQADNFSADEAGGGGGGSASATPAPLTTTPATATATGAASASATPAPVSATPAQATATGGAAAQATPAPLTTSAAQAAATGAAQAAATPAPVQLSPATATASGASGGEVVASATPAPVGLSAPTATATGSASAQAAPAPITTTAPTASVGSGASAGATLAALGLMPATGMATGGAAASAIPAQIIITPAAGNAKGGAQAYSTPAQIIITPATGTGSDGAYEPITWPATAATATVPRASLVAVVPAAPFAAYVLRTNHTAIAPPTGDDMQPITTFEMYSQDREVYNINFAARYMPEGDTADRLLAIGHDPGVTVTTQVPVGGAVSSGVVFFAVDDPTGPGTYKVWAQISTTAGRERTGVVLVNVGAV